LPGERTSSQPHIDELIERGLERYGEGDLDGALSEWEGVLAEEPSNDRAREYVDYVRQNYDLLAEQFRVAREATDGATALGIPLGEGGDDLDAYDLVELEGEPRPVRETTPAPRVYEESVDEGWFLDQESSAADSLPPPPTASPPQRGLTAELDLGTVADEVMGGVEEAIAASAMAPEEDDEPSYQDGVIELEAEMPQEGTRGGFALEDPERDQRSLELMNDPASDDGEPAAADDLDFGSPGLTQERTAELRTQQLADLAGSETGDDEVTVPGGEEPPPFGAGLSLSDDALAALGADGRSAGEPTQGPDEITAERSTLGPGFALGELDELDLSTPRDDRAHDDDEVRVTFRPEGTGTGALGGRQHDDDEGELTVERGSARTAAGTTERSPIAGDGAELDDEMTRERDSARWDTDLLSLPDDLGEDATKEHRAAPPGPELADTMEVGTIDLGMPELGEDQGGWPRAGTEEATAERRRGEFDDPANQQTADLPGIDIGMAPLTDESMSMDAISAQLDREIDRDAPADESLEDRTRRRVAALIKRAESEANLNHPSTAVTALDMALDEDPDSAIAQKVIHRHRDLLFDIYQGYIGDMAAMPTLAIPLHQLAQERLDNRAAFLLSRIDGSLSFEEILDVSGMTRLEAYRLLSRMLLRGILEVH
jgi:hypothetical protein